MDAERWGRRKTKGTWKNDAGNAVAWFKKYNNRKCGLERPHSVQMDKPEMQKESYQVVGS